MKILNFGSLNYDYVYSLHHIVKPGETISSVKVETFCGGKGLNQSIALTKAGVKVYHAGMIGEDGEGLLQLCEENGIDHRFIRKMEGKSGHTIIQVDEEGQNCIILSAGSNGKNTEEHIDEVLSGFSEGDMLLLQNEINLINIIIEKAYEKKMKIILNPSPFNRLLEQSDLRKISIFIMNEIEGCQITGESRPERILERMKENYPDSEVILTLGEAGVMYSGKGVTYSHECIRVKAVDTTAAGDTFTGYYIGAIQLGMTVEQALHRASVAASITVTRMGAADSIPCKAEVDDMVC
jgi:ribokinase